MEIVPVRVEASKSSKSEGSQKPYSNQGSYGQQINSWRRSISCRNQSTTDLQSKSMDWFLYDRDLRKERINASHIAIADCKNYNGSNLKTSENLGIAIQRRIQNLVKHLKNFS